MSLVAPLFTLFSTTLAIVVALSTRLRTVPSFVTAHTFCASQVWSKIFGFLKESIQRYYCPVYDYGETDDLMKGYQNPKNLGGGRVTGHFPVILNSA